MKRKILLLLILCSVLSSCLLSESSKHRKFSSISDCGVYEDQVKTEVYLFGKVEYIKMNADTGKCLKNQLQNTYLLYVNKDIIVVHGKHPKNNIQLILKEYKKHLTDTTKLNEIFVSKDRYSIGVNRLCKDETSIRNNEFIDWKQISFQKENNNFKTIKTKIFNYFYDWNEKEKNKTTTYNVVEFLKKPLDLQEFKKKKLRNAVTTSVQNGKEYYFNPKIKDSTYYNYNFIIENDKQNSVNKIVVYKHGENKHSFEDETEVLIELKISNHDADLGKANLVGLSKAELEAKIGKSWLMYNDQRIYTHKNNILCIELDDSKVTSFRYIKLNTSGITDYLLEKIQD